jgi:hypothetical protein
VVGRILTAVAAGIGLVLAIAVVVILTLANPPLALVALGVPPLVFGGLTFVRRWRHRPQPAQSQSGSGPQILIPDGPYPSHPAHGPSPAGRSRSASAVVALGGVVLAVALMSTFLLVFRSPVLLSKVGANVPPPVPSGQATPGIDLSLPQTVTVTYTANVSAVGDRWRMHEEFVIPPASADRIDRIIVATTNKSNAAPSNKSVAPSLRPGDGIEGLPQRIPSEWVFEVKDGLQSYTRDREFPVLANSIIPLSATDEFELPELTVDPGIRLRIGAGSIATVKAPSHMIRRIYPPAEPKPIPDGLEEATVSLYGPSDRVLRIEAMSPVARNELGSRLVGFSFTGAALAAAGLAGTIATALMAFFVQERVKRWFARRGPKRRRPGSSKKKPIAATPPPVTLGVMTLGLPSFAPASSGRS